ncbi:MAG: TldD/PmbA family protein, partial [Chloroflexota bacterium]|nr:TldD/PmbA family protein [Chloroflexota bacterium]
YSTAQQTEVALTISDAAVTRFANSYIHQNVAESGAWLSVRAVMGKKIGMASTDSLKESSLKEAALRACRLADLQAETPDFISLPSPSPLTRVEAWAEGTARCTPERRAKAVGVVCRLSQEKGLTASGALSTTISQRAIANSLGIFAYHRETQAEMSAVIMSDTSSGYADALSLDMDHIDPELLAQEAIDKALRSRNPVSLGPGEYEVVLEPYAVSDVLDFLAYPGLGAMAFHEGRSFMAGKLGQSVLGANITLWDDALAPNTIPVPFDCEGVPKRRLELITGGVARAVCYDSYTAGKEGKVSTGHALPPGWGEGPLPTHLFLQPGTATLEEMVASVRRGLLITRFHYTRTLHPLTVI